MMKKLITLAGLLVCLFCLSPQIDAQLIKTRLDFVGGISYPEYIHGGIRYQYTEKMQIGLYYGGDMEFKPEIIRTWSLDHMYHFGKHNFFSNRPVWYTRQGFTYSMQTDETYLYRHTYLNLSLGHEFPLNNHIGLNFDMGMNVKIYETVDYKDTREQAFNPDPRWYPGFLARFQLFVSL